MSRFRFTQLSLCAVWFVAASVTAVPLSGQNPNVSSAATPATRGATVDDLLSFSLVSAPAISPDGQWVAYVVTYADFEDNINRSTIWLVAAEGGTPIQLTRGPRADRAPQWAPGGTWLAFLSDRENKGQAQVYGIRPTGGEPWPLTAAHSGVISFQISPDGKRIAYTARPKATDRDEELENKRGRPIVRDSAYASDWAQLWVIPTVDLAQVGQRAAAVEPKPDGAQRSSPELLDVTSLEWAPDSRRIAWSAKPSPPLRSNRASAVYVQDDIAAAPRKVSDLPGAETVVAWTTELGLVIAASAHELGTFNRRLWVVPETGGPPVSLTDNLDEDAQFVAATATALYIEAARRTGRGLFRIPLANGRASGAPRPVSDTSRFYSAFSATETGDVVAFLAETGDTAPNVHVAPVRRFAPRRLTDVNPQAEALRLGEQRVVRWSSAADGEEIEGILHLPIEYRAGARVPLLLVIHGGPAGVSSNRYPPVRGAYPIPVFNALGYAVLQPNYRGSAGYGERFRGLNRGHISGTDWVDVNSGVDYLIAQGIADSARLGIMGWSFGGHHTYWGITQTTRFKAASAGAGANDLISMYSQTDLPEFYHTYLGPRPWEDFELYESRSAYRFVNRVTTPLLVQVGEADRRVPAEQSIQFYEAMKEIGKASVTLVLYPGQPHGIQDPRLQRDLMRRNVEWFSRWIPERGMAQRAPQDD